MIAKRLIAKPLIAALALAGSFAAVLAPTEARADVDVDVAIGVGGYYPAYDDLDGYDRGYDEDYGERYYERRHYRPRHHYDDYEDVAVYISCGEGKRLLRRLGYRDVRTENCRAPNYKYKARRNGHWFAIRMDTSGDINRIRRVR